mmetsp:Transcript_26814/g.58822  ORF Transcript_26814/g.58822 Transcript_26814/m.58822 type:complete len:146 (-) Transcript_26814:253-690(-)
MRQLLQRLQDTKGIRNEEVEKQGKQGHRWIWERLPNLLSTSSRYAATSKNMSRGSNNIQSKNRTVRNENITNNPIVFIAPITYQSSYDRHWIGWKYFLVSDPSRIMLDDKNFLNYCQLNQAFGGMVRSGSLSLQVLPCLAPRFYV